MEEYKQLRSDENDPLFDKTNMMYKVFPSDYRQIRYFTLLIVQSAPLENRSQDSAFSVPNKTEKKNTERNDTDLSIPPSSPRDSPTRAQRQQMRMDEMDSYRELIKENISYDLLLQENPYDDELIDGYVELILKILTPGFPKVSL